MAIHILFNRIKRGHKQYGKTYGKSHYNSDIKGK